MQPAALLAALSALVAVSASAEGPLAQGCTCRGHVLVCVHGNWTALPTLPPCPDATTIELQGNLFESLPDGLTRFVTVGASHNRLTHLPQASTLHPEIANLVLSNNLISGTSNEFRTLSTLRRVRIEQNNLTSLNFLPEQCNLHSLDVSGNAITSLAGPLHNCAELTFLGLDGNQITTVSREVFSRMNKLKHLYLANNQITSIPDGTFADLGALIDLALPRNRNIQLSSDSFQGLSHLQNLDISYNELHTLPTGLFTPTPQLRKLTLSKNKLTALPASTFLNLHALKDLSLWDNDLTQVPVLENCCESLEEYNLLSNIITNPSQEALLSVLRGKIATNIGSQVQPASLRWVSSAPGVETYTGSRCSCGGLRRGTAKVEFCVDTPCGTDSSYADWRAAVAAA